MARGSREDKRQQRANDELSALEKAMRRGQRPDPITTIDNYLELAPPERAAHFDFVQTVVARVLDDMGVRAPANAILIAWCPRLERAPELVRGRDEPEATALERWWGLMRACLVGRLPALAQRLWLRLAPAASATAPQLERLIAAWLEDAGASLSDGEFEALRPTLEALAAARREFDARLGKESPRQLDALAPTSSEADVRAFVETIFLARSVALSQLRGVARGLSRENASRVWAEAAPFLLRDALARDSVELLRGFAEASENAGGKVLVADVETALRWSFAQALAQARAASPKDARHASGGDHAGLFARLAITALELAPQLAERIEGMLLQQSPDRVPFTPELVQLLARLLRATSRLPSAALWTWVMGVVPHKTKVDHSALAAPLSASLPPLLEAPRALAEALARLSKQVQHDLFDTAFKVLSSPLLVELLAGLWPVTNAGLRQFLTVLFDDLVERLDREGAPRKTNAKGRSGGPPIPPEFERALDDMIDDGESVESALEMVLEDMPPPLAIMMRSALLDYARKGPAGPSEAGIALWSRLGRDIVAQSPNLLPDGLRHVPDPDTRLAFVDVVLASHERLEDWIELTHRILQSDGSKLFATLMGRTAERFGDTIDTWRRAHIAQSHCDCFYSEGIAKRLIAAYSEAGDVPPAFVRELKGRFPEVVRIYERYMKPAKRPAAKKVPAAKKAPAAKVPAAKKVLAAKKVPAAKKESLVLQPLLWKEESAVMKTPAPAPKKKEARP